LHQPPIAGIGPLRPSPPAPTPGGERRSPGAAPPGHPTAARPRAPPQLPAPPTPPPSATSTRVFHSLEAADYRKVEARLEENYRGEPERPVPAGLSGGACREVCIRLQRGMRTGCREVCVEPQGGMRGWIAPSTGGCGNPGSVPEWKLARPPVGAAPATRAPFSGRQQRPYRGATWQRLGNRTSASLVTSNRSPG